MTKIVLIIGVGRQDGAYLAQLRIHVRSVFHEYSKVIMTRHIE